MSYTIPGGPRKGTELEAAEVADLNFWIDRTRKTIQEDPNGQFVGKNKAWLAAAEAELARRASGGAVAAKPAPAGAVPPEESAKAIQLYSGAHDDAKRATQALQKLQEVGHLISPAPACGTLPIGTAIAISAVTVDAENETFPIAGGGQGEGKLGIGKVPMYKFASALGINWSSESRRIDDRSDACYVYFVAVGYVRNFDGSWMRITGEKVMDLRDGSPQLAGMQDQTESKFKREHEKWEADGRKGREPKMGDWKSQVRDMRLRILEHAETKAKLRAIRSLGMRSSYTRAELSKPFFVARLQFTGQSDDPVIKQMFATRIADAMLGGTQMLYGRTEPSSARHDSSPQPYVKPPPIDAHGESIDDEDGVGVDAEFQT